MVQSTRPRGPYVLLAALAGLLAACSSTPSSAIAVAITVDAGVIADCIRVGVAAPGAAEELSPATPRKDALEVAIYPGGALTGQVNLIAHAYVGAADCSGTLLINAQSAPASADFGAQKIGHVSLEIFPPGPDVDQDRDGYWAEAQGGPDCDDADPGIHPGVKEVCDNGIDDNCNGLVDCQDPQCPTGSTCSDDNLCTSQDACTNSGACVGQPISCGPLPDGGVCVSGWSCDPRSGLCDTVPSDAGTPCDDGNACTANDVCSAAGQCVGTPLCGSPPGDCYVAIGACTGDGGCDYSPDPSRLYAACDGGICRPDGTCSPSGFPYPPSNFDPTLIPTSQIVGNVVLGCAATFDSTPDASTPFPSWCNQPEPVILPIHQDGGPDAVVLSMFGLSIPSSGSLQLVGPRPVILAVYDSAWVAGQVLATSSYTAAGAGGSPAGCGTAAGGSGTLAGGTGAGGGGAGFGAAGAAGGAGGAGGIAGAAGIATGAASAVPLTGGCPGGVGGTSGGTAGAGGAGGGAVQISSAGHLVVTGVVSASGGGGRGAVSNGSGGGGGGSGGAVLLEGQVLQIAPSAALTSNGGGGGKGASPTVAGGDGSNGNTTNALPAQGGQSGAPQGGSGGSGGVAASAATVGAVGAPQGGGGGGGGVGRIRLNANAACAVDAGAVLSPAPSKQGCS